jgi:hypothetical protein
MFRQLTAKCPYCGDQGKMGINDEGQIWPKPGSVPPFSCDHLMVTFAVGIVPPGDTNNSTRYHALYRDVIRSLEPLEEYLDALALAFFKDTPHWKFAPECTYAPVSLSVDSDPLTGGVAFFSPNPEAFVAATIASSKLRRNSHHRRGGSRDSTYRKAVDWGVTRVLDNALPPDLKRKLSSK